MLHAHATSYSTVCYCMCIQMKHTHQALVMFSGHSAAYYCFGRLLFAFIRGWEEQDKEEVFTLIQAVVKYVCVYV